MEEHFSRNLHNSACSANSVPLVRLEFTILSTQLKLFYHLVIVQRMKNEIQLLFPLSLVKSFNERRRVKLTSETSRPLDDSVLRNAVDAVIARRGDRDARKVLSPRQCREYAFLPLRSPGLLASERRRGRDLSPMLPALVIARRFMPVDS